MKRKQPDSPEDKHESARKRARDHTFESAVRMATYYNKTKAAKPKDFKIGDKVSFPVPKIDRCTTDMQRISGEIINVTGNTIKFYKVATSVGVIKTHFRGGDLSNFSGTVGICKNKVVSVRQAAMEINAANKFTVNRCKM